MQPQVVSILLVQPQYRNQLTKCNRVYRLSSHNEGQEQGRGGSCLVMQHTPACFMWNSLIVYSYTNAYTSCRQQLYPNLTKAAKSFAHCECSDSIILRVLLFCCRIFSTALCLWTQRQREVPYSTTRRHTSLGSGGTNYQPRSQTLRPPALILYVMRAGSVKVWKQILQL